MAWTKVVEMALKLSLADKVRPVSFLSGELESDVENLQAQFGNAKTSMRLVRKLNRGKNEDIDSLLADDEDM